jgi:hypothetical protein
MVTIFKNFNEVVEHKTIATILEEIKTGKYKPGIIYLRKSLAEKKRKHTTKPKNHFQHSHLQESLLVVENWNS